LEVSSVRKKGPPVITTFAFLGALLGAASVVRGVEPLAWTWVGFAFAALLFAVGAAAWVIERAR
jgi:hypothetical protein